jgi:hypothetical protein
MGRAPRAGSHAESLDEFFSETDEGGSEGEEGRAPPPPSAAADLEAFNAWLEGLKK